MTVTTLFILYVADQNRSRDFYQKVLQLQPTLDVPGMTEFPLGESAKLGLMPEDGIARILGDRLPHPKTGSGIPRCELYLIVDEPQNHMDSGIAEGGSLVSPLQERNWGDNTGYIADPDGHVLAFAEKRTTP